MSEGKTTDIDVKGRKVILHDMCLRDGMHAKREQISVEQMVKVATALDEQALGDLANATEIVLGAKHKIHAPGAPRRPQGIAAEAARAVRRRGPCAWATRSGRRSPTGACSPPLRPA